MSGLPTTKKIKIKYRAEIPLNITHVNYITQHINTHIHTHAYVHV